jgi:hypothetical protein
MEKCQEVEDREKMGGHERHGRTRGRCWTREAMVEE